MADISTISVGGTTYNVKDPVARGAIPGTATALPASGTALEDNTVYTIPSSAPVGTYTLTAPTIGWSHGTFHTDLTVALTVSPESSFAFEASKQYEFSVDNGNWIFREVTT